MKEAVVVVEAAQVRLVCLGRKMQVVLAVARLSKAHL